MKNDMSAFMPFSDAVSGREDIRKLITMRRDAVTRYGLFTPDALYPVYECPHCGATEVSLSLLAPEPDPYEDFSCFLAEVSRMAGALPLAPCKGCGKGNPSSPRWIGLFTFLVEAGADLFLHLEEGRVTESFKVPVLGDPSPLGPLNDDSSFLEVFGFPFSHRWAWRRLAESASERPGFRVKKMGDGLYFGVGRMTGDIKQRWTGWFADNRHEAGLDRIACLSVPRPGPYADEGPSAWLDGRAARLFERGELELVVFYSSSRFRSLLESTLLQRGIRMTPVRVLPPANDGSSAEENAGASPKQAARPGSATAGPGIDGIDGFDALKDPNNGNGSDGRGRSTSVSAIDGDGAERPRERARGFYELSLEEYSCVIDLESLLEAAVHSAYPVDRLLRRNLLGRIEFLEGLRGVGRRLVKAFGENYLTSIEDGHVLVVSSPDDRRTLRRIELDGFTEAASAPGEDFERLLREEFGFDPESGLFQACD